MPFPYLAKTTLKYKSPHATDLSFAKGETIRVTGPSPDDEDWLVGETLDGSSSGGFPKDFIEPIEGDEAVDAAVTDGAATAGQPESAIEVAEPEESAADADDDKSTAAQEPVASTPQPEAPAPTPAVAPTPSHPGPPTTTPAPTAADPSADPSDPSRLSMKDRLAFFTAAQNKAAGPPPPIKPKPASGGLTWSQRQKLRQEQEAKEREAQGGASADTSSTSAATPAAATAAPAATPSVPDLTSSGGGESGGQKENVMSAADAVNSIAKGGSLKERMAALQGAGAFGRPIDEKPPAPQPSGKVWTRPPAPPHLEQEEGEEGASVERGMGMTQPLAGGELGEVAAPGEEAEAAGGEEEEGEKDEEEKEKARRAAIAARMAKLGARGPLGMMAPRPVVASNPPAAIASTDAEVDKPVSTGAETSESITTTETETTALNAAPQSIKLPSVPRRAVPPRRRGPLPSAPSPGASGDITESEKQESLEKTTPGGTIEPPSQVMVAGEEDPLPKTAEQFQREEEEEVAGRGGQGVAGALAAGIALEPVAGDEVERQASTMTSKQPKLVGAIGSADDVVRSKGTTKAGLGPGEIVQDELLVPAEPRELEEGEEEGGDERDEIMNEAQSGQLAIGTGGVELASPTRSQPRPIAVVPLAPPAGAAGEVEDEEKKEEEENVSPPVSHHPATTIGGFGKDEVELKHEHDIEIKAEDPDQGQEDEVEEEEEGDEPPPPPPRSINRPPMPVPTTALPPPPKGNALVPPRNDEEEEREEEEVEIEDGEVENQRVQEEDEEEETAPPPPPRRRPSLPVPATMPIQTSGLASGPECVTSPTSPSQVQSPPVMIPPSPTRALPEINATTDAGGNVDRNTGIIAPDDEEAIRRKGIAARMAKLGGIKFGMPPPMPRRSAPGDGSDTVSPVSPNRVDQSNISASNTAALPRESSQDESSRANERSAGMVPEVREIADETLIASNCEGGGEDETPEQEAARRRATLARLRAGGALGFGMFSHGHASSQDEEIVGQTHEDLRGIESSPAVTPLQESPPVIPIPPAPHKGELDQEAEDEEEGDDAPPPPPPLRPVIDTQQQQAQAAETSPQSPHRRTPSFGKRSTSNRTSLPPPPIPEGSAPPPPSLGAATSDWEITDEPAVMMMQHHEEGNGVPPPPVPPGRPSVSSGLGSGAGAGAGAGQFETPESPRRSMSSASRAGYTGQPPSRQTTRDSTSVSQPPPMSTPPPMAPGRQSMTGATRPGFNELQEASATRGVALARAAKGLFDRGKKGNYGDGSPEGFVMLALERAGLRVNEENWGTLVYEQEGESILKRFDEPRPGDIIALHDARFKGKKGLSSYNQQVGSVEQPLVGIIMDFDNKSKHKFKVAQVERGIADEVSYRGDDLKSGRVCVYRP